MQEDAGRAAGDACRIGAWMFLPDSNELRSGESRRRIEDRAARTLALLCRRRGQIVSQDEILAEVWNGRAISANSVPVVIKDIRKALGDDAREPRHIETVAKRGYRLLAEVDAFENPPVEDRGSTTAPTAAEEPRTEPAATERPRRAALTLALAAAALILLAVAAVFALTRFAPFGWPAGETSALIVPEVENATGSARYQVLAAASSDVILLNAQQMKGIRVYRDAERSDRTDAFTLRARLILWYGRPTIMLAAQAPDGAILYTAMTSGEERLIPPEIRRAVRELEAEIHRARSSEKRRAPA